MKSFFLTFLFSRLMPIVYLAIAYFAVGKLTLLLAIPPGYASPIWPAAGVALYGILRFGYRVWPGVVLGSFLLNIVPTVETIGSPSAALFILPASIGIAAGLQACLGAFLVRRYSCFPTPSDHIEYLFKTMLLGGPLSCLVNATLGPLLLLSFGMIQLGDYPENWLIWWVGDTLGVLVVITFFSSWTREMKQARLKKRLLSSVSVAFIFLLVVAGFLYIRNSEWQRSRISFEKKALQITKGFHSHVQSYIEDLYAISALFNASKEVDRHEFKTFVLPFLDRHPGIQALEWVPRITHEEKAAFLDKVQQGGYPSFTITEKTPTGVMAPASERVVYFPVYYVEPYEGNEKVLGFDLASNPERFETMQKAYKSRMPTVSPGVTLIQEDDNNVGVLIFLPVFLQKKDVHGHDEDAEFSGYALGVFQVGNIVKEALANFDSSGIEYHLDDVTSPEDRQLLYSSQTGAAEDSLSQLQWRTTIEVGERLWLLRFYTTDDYFLSQQNWQAYIFLTGGLFFASLFGTYILMFIGRAEKIKQTVQEKTSELTSAKNALEEEIGERKKVEIALLETQSELEQKVKERTAELLTLNKELRMREEGLTEAQKMAHLGSWDWDIVEDDLKWSDEMCRIFATTPNDFKGKYADFINAIHVDDREYVQNSMDAALAEKKPYRLEYRIVHPGGTPRIGFSQGKVSFNEKNEPVRMVGTVLDITERKNIEEALKESLEELVVLNKSSSAVNASLSLKRVSKAAINAITSLIAPDMIIFYLLDNDHLTLQNFYSTNPNETRTDDHTHKVGVCLCGRAAETGEPVYSRHIHSDALCTLPECKEADYHSFAAIPLVFGETILGVLGLASRAERDFQKQGTFLETLANQIAIGVQNALFYEELQQQAEKLELEVRERTKELHIAMEQAQESDQLKSAFLATMSHELRTPLNSIIGFTGIILMGLTGDLNDEQRKQLEMAQQSARHLLNLINDVLDISKIEAGQLDVALEHFSMAETIEKVLETMMPTARKKGLELLGQVSEDVGLIKSDKRRVEQILINLINNAVKFTDEGTVNVWCDIQSNTLVTCVKDSGVGIKPEDMEKLFFAFHQLDTGLNRKHDGTGLGLSICQKLVELLGGEIWAESAGPDKGSTFTFTLPMETKGGQS